MNRYPHLLAPIQVGSHLLPNRVIMGSIHTRLETMDRAQQRLAMFYAERARGGPALIITGAFAPSPDGRIEDSAPILATRQDMERVAPIASAVHESGGRILLQIIHAGRYAKLANPLGASAIPSSINPRAPRALTTDEVWNIVDEFARCAQLAIAAGFDGVEIMGSEGYLINQFAARRTNDRSDIFGGTIENRHRFAIEIVKRVRHYLGPDPILMFRISAIDLVEDGSTRDEILQLAQGIEQAGADILNTGIGWHESPVPTIMYTVPRGAWRFAAARLRDAVSIPVIASNRINTPELADEIIAHGEADMVSLARPFLADSQFVAKAAQDRADEINTCIACNQACLDYIFRDRPVSCLVNPRAGRELDFSEFGPARSSKRIGVVGAGLAGLACATSAAERGHKVVLFEAAADIGGQARLAAQVPGKREFVELMRYFRRRAEVLGVDLRCTRRLSAGELAAAPFDHIVVATGVRARQISLPCSVPSKLVGYQDLLCGRVEAGARVAIIGAGGIGFDVAEYLLGVPGAEPALQTFVHEWGVDTGSHSNGGLTKPRALAPQRRVTLLQRKPQRPGRSLGLSTGWALKSKLARSGVEMLSGCEYLRLDAAGLHVLVAGEPRVLEVDTVVVCAGQESERSVYDELRAMGRRVELIGGAAQAAELDALRAIDEGTRLAMEF